MSVARWRTRNRISAGNALLVGLTGGIGSGKSLAGEAFRRRGRIVLSADLLAREIADSDPATKRRIRQAFGAEAYTAGGRLNRPLIATIVFSQPRLLARLNSIIHPRVFQVIDQTLQKLPLRSRFPYVLIEAALIYESGMEKTMDYVIVVDAPRTVRLRRVMARDGVTALSVRRRMQSQMSAMEKRRRASFVLENSGTRLRLFREVEMLDRVLVSIAKGRGIANREKSRKRQDGWREPGRRGPS